MNQSLDANDVRKSIERHFTQALEDLKATASDRSGSTVSVDVEIDALDVIHQAYCREINEMKRKRFERRNTLIPIHTLPNELLAYVLVLSLRPFDKKTLVRLRALAQVSRYWWSLILHTPSFWTRIDATTMLRTQLRRSGNLPLDIFLHKTPIDDEQGNLLKAEFHRFRALCYHLSDWGVLVPSSGMAGSQLQYICIGRDIKWRRRLDIDQVCPLRHLDLEHVYPDWAASYFGRLTYLALRLYDSNVGGCKVPMLAFAQAMDSCIMLEELCLDTVIPDDYTLLPTAVAGERLPRLRRLSLLTIPERLSSYVLHSLHPFQIEEFRIEQFAPEFTDLPPEHADTLPPVAQSFISSIILRTPNLRVNLRISSDEFEASFLQGAQTLVEMRIFGCEDYAAALQRFLQGIAAERVPTALDLDAYVNNDSIVDMITGFPHSQLELRYLQISASTIYDTHIVHSFTGFERFPFQNISHLHFDGLSIDSADLPVDLGHFIRALLRDMSEHSKRTLLVTDEDASWEIRDANALGGIRDFLRQIDGRMSVWPRMTTSHASSTIESRHMRQINI